MTGIGLTYVLYVASFTQSIWLAVMSSEKDLEKFIREKVDQSAKAFNSRKDLAKESLKGFTGAASNGSKEPALEDPQSDVSNPLHNGP